MLKKVSSSTLQCKTSSNQEDRRSFIRSLSSEFEAMANKSIREFSAPTTNNIHTGPTMEIDRTFELKPGLINMVQANQFYGKAHKDASAHLQHFLEICSTFRLFPFSLLGRAKLWLYPTKNKNSTWALCSMNFLAKFFPMGKTNSLCGKITSFQQQYDESIPEVWERFQDYILECPHHGMESWLLMQMFYHGLSNSTRETIDAYSRRSIPVTHHTTSHSPCGEDGVQPRLERGEDLDTQEKWRYALAQGDRHVVCKAGPAHEEA